MRKTIRKLLSFMLIFSAACVLIALSGCVGSEQTRVLALKSVQFPEGACFPLETVTTSALLINDTGETKNVWTELTIRNRAGVTLDRILQEGTLLPGTELRQELAWTVPPDIAGGNYALELIVRDREPTDKTAEILASRESEKRLICYSRQDDFSVWDETFWNVSDKTLGRTEFLPENITVADGTLSVAIPAGTLDGGEIYTAETQSFGAYEARMKLPAAPSSITGFFMYSPPDYYYEIDMELPNQPDGTILLTTYADGQKSNTLTVALGFDPTAAFHNYRIEYYEDGVEFYVDDRYLAGWSDCRPKERMHLMLNVWFPDWLEGICPTQTQSLRVDWIRY